ncbi:hypothetical protein [Chromohalobacter israelensis]|uniref:hypothetical protein n=1 Tax=Chromohalobacter israelensis TaxID=141390 RepID=UPI000FFE3C97|nr:hypothetical protein [Chromohalobacter salexigens]RXE49188.1 hypothetical protein B4O83_14910 [Chromohalobacter salexigens]
MPTTNPILRLIDTDEIGAASVSQLLHDMGAEQSPNVAVAITRRHQFQPFAALVCLHGPHTARYMAAFEAVTQAIKHEQQQQTGSQS